MLKNSREHLTILQIFTKYSENELALSRCEPIHNLSGPENFSTHIFGQLVFPGDTLFTEQYTSISFSWTIEFIFFVNI